MSSGKENLYQRNSSDHDSVAYIDEFDEEYFSYGEEDKENVKTRKRKRNVQNWGRNKWKKRRNLGQSYVNYVGVEISGKSLKKGCLLKCRNKCQEIIPLSVRQEVFEYFYNLSSKEQKWDYIARCVQVVDKKITKISSRPSLRNSSRIYHLNYSIENEVMSQKVCKIMFLDTLCISNQVVETALAKVVSGESDNRGKFTRPVNELKEATKNYIKRHISMFPTVESHYLRAQTSKVYLDGNLNVSKMFRLFEEWIRETAIKIEYVTERQYRDVFNHNFNISFFVPKKDKCNECAMYENMSVVEKKKFEPTYLNHQLMKKEARRLKELDKATAKYNRNIVTACFDFQKVLQCPFGETSTFYYKRKLAIHNFTVYNMGNNKGHCFLWDETTGKQGSCEVASCLYIFMLNEIAKNQNITKFLFWSDNCPGQNKNKILLSFYSWASAKLNVDISHKYLEKGHTQNEGDSVHALIEKRRKNQQLYVPSQYYGLIRNAKCKGSPYDVYEIEQTDLYDFKSYSNFFWFQKNFRNEKVDISGIREIYISGKDPNKLSYKVDFNDDFKIIIMYETAETKKRGRKKKKKCDVISKLYNSKIRLNSDKKKDLMYLCDHKFIPSYYREFYESLDHE